MKKYIVERKIVKAQEPFELKDDDIPLSATEFLRNENIWYQIQYLEAVR